MTMATHLPPPVQANAATPNFLTISFIEEDSFKFTLKNGDGVCLPNPDWELVPQERSLVAEGSGSHSTFRDSGNHK